MFLPSRQKRLLSKLPGLMRGSFTPSGRSCEKKECRWRRGEKPIYFFGYSIKGRKRILSIPAESHQEVQKLISNCYHHKGFIEELTRRS